MSLGNIGGRIKLTLAYEKTTGVQYTLDRLGDKLMEFGIYFVLLVFFRSLSAKAEEETHRLNMFVSLDGKS